MSENEKMCPDCAESVKLAARVCRFCAHQFTTPAEIYTAHSNVDGSDLVNVDQPTQSKHRGSIIVACSLVALLFIAYLVAMPLFTETEQQSSEIDSFLVAGDTTPAPHSWAYDTSRDDVRNAEIKSASLSSDNEVQLAMPYGGGTQAKLIVRKHPEYGIDIILQANPSQMLCDSYYGCSIDINIDGKSQKVRMVTPADYDTEVLFVKNARGFLSQLKGSKKVIVEVPFYSNGNHQFHFTTAGLVWVEK